MKFILAIDSFKGSLTNAQMNEILEKVIKGKMPNASVVPLLVADGGDGTLDAIITGRRGEIVPLKVCNPLFEKVDSRYGVFNDSAVISMCESSGLTMIPESDRNPLYTTTYGTGELIKDAVLSGKKTIYITLGGSATNDGGLGTLTALGYKMLKKDGTIAKGIGAELGEIVSIDDSNAIDISNVKFVILSDVTNPLTGEKGATKVFAKQKGATPEMIEFLEKGMISWQKVLSDYTKKDVGVIVGGGAAGGMGASLCSVLNAEIKSGVEEILNIVDYDKELTDADYVITGEGRIDEQSIDGKVVSGVISRAKEKNVPVIAIVGTIKGDLTPLFNAGLTAVFSIIDKPTDLDDIIARSPALYERVADSVINLIKTK